MMSKLLSIAPKINMEPENDGLVQMISFFQGCILGFQPFIFGGVLKNSESPRNRTNLLEQQLDKCRFQRISGVHGKKH